MKSLPGLAWAAISNSASATMPTPFHPCYQPCPKAGNNGSSRSIESGAAAWFLDPNDAAISKYVRSEPRDREWIRAGLQVGILSLPTIEYRLRETLMETDEMRRTQQAIAEDRKELGIE